MVDRKKYPLVRNKRRKGSNLPKLAWAKTKQGYKKRHSRSLRGRSPTKVAGGRGTDIYAGIRIGGETPAAKKPRKRVTKGTRSRNMTKTTSVMLHKKGRRRTSPQRWGGKRR